MIPITGRANSFLDFLFVCLYVNRKEEEEGATEQQLQSYQFTQSYITRHRLQVHHLTLTFIIHNQYMWQDLGKGTLSRILSKSSFWHHGIELALSYKMHHSLRRQSNLLWSYGRERSFVFVYSKK